MELLLILLGIDSSVLSWTHLNRVSFVFTRLFFDSGITTSIVTRYYSGHALRIQYTLIQNVL